VPSPVPDADALRWLLNAKSSLLGVSQDERNFLFALIIDTTRTLNAAFETFISAKMFTSAVRFRVRNASIIKPEKKDFEAFNQARRTKMLKERRRSPLLLLSDGLKVN
jgi:hypothetical protein